MSEDEKINKKMSPFRLQKLRKIHGRAGLFGKSIPYIPYLEIIRHNI